MLLSLSFHIFTHGLDKEVYEKKKCMMPQTRVTGGWTYRIMQQRVGQDRAM